MRAELVGKARIIDADHTSRFGSDPANLYDSIVEGCQLGAAKTNDPRIRLAKWAGITTMLLGVVDVLLRVQVVGDVGLEWSLHDPGKVAFHILILPIAVALLIACSSQKCISSAWRTQKPKLLAVLVATFIALIFFSVAEGVNGMCDRLPMPYDLRGSDAEVLEDGFSSSNATNYQARVDEIRGDTCNLDTFLVRSSVRAKYAIFLTFLGMSAAVALLILLGLHPLTKTPLEAPQFSLLLAVASLLCVWFALRAYSEWYINFRQPPVGYAPFILAGFFAFIVFFLLQFVRETRDLANILTWGFVTAVAGAIAAAYTFWFEGFHSVASAIAALDVEYIVMIYFILALGLGSAALHTFRVAKRQYAPKAPEE